MESSKIKLQLLHTFMELDLVVKAENIFHAHQVTTDVFGLVTGFTRHFIIQLLTTFYKSLLHTRLNEIYSKVHIGIHLPESFPIQNDLKDLSPLRFNFALGYIITEVQRKPGRTEIEWNTSGSGLC
jgi:hypothetical protein